MTFHTIFPAKLCRTFWTLDFILIMLRLNMSFKLIFASSSEPTLIAYLVGDFMFWFYVPCQRSLFREINATVIASDSHVIALKVGNKLRNFRNAPLFITSVPNSPGSSFRHIHFVTTFTFVSSQLPGLVTFTFVMSQLPGLATFTFVYFTTWNFYYLIQT